MGHWGNISKHFLFVFSRAEWATGVFLWPITFFLISICSGCYVFPGGKWKISGKMEHRQEAFYVIDECFFYSDVLYNNIWIKTPINHAVKINLCMQVKECHRSVVAGVRGGLQYNNPFRDKKFYCAGAGLNVGLLKTGNYPFSCRVCVSKNFKVFCLAKHLSQTQCSQAHI